MTRRVSGIVAGVSIDFNNAENARVESCRVKMESLARVSTRLNHRKQYNLRLLTFMVCVKHILIGIAKSEVIGNRGLLFLSL